MGRVLLGILLGMALMCSSAWALRIERPPEFVPEWDTNRITQLNNFLLGVHNILNGRYQANTTTVDPDGNRMGIAGECVYFDSGTDQWCCNATGTLRSPTTVWRCVNLT